MTLKKDMTEHEVVNIWFINILIHVVQVNKKVHK